MAVPAQRLPRPRLRVVVGRPADADQLLVPWWLPAVFIAFALLLAPWIVWLIVTLPSQEVASHWEIAWGGFDVALAALLAATAITLTRRSSSAEIFAAMTGAFLLCDAWFDVMTSHGHTLIVALLEAFFVELPLAITCLWIARNVERVVADMRPFLERAGFRIEQRRLVPPDDCDTGRR
ncbi:MAG: hypothetical protein QOI27_2098 [Gaiellaceae bacterium]|jgi:hypothetical protein|nr:hypothetical protein [Gaiellaceae bacterium]